MDAAAVAQVIAAYLVDRDDFAIAFVDTPEESLDGASGQIVTQGGGRFTFCVKEA